MAAFTPGEYVPSARFRVRQYVPDLLDSGVAVREFYPRSVDSSPPKARIGRMSWLVRFGIERLVEVINGSRTADLLLFQRQLIPTVNSFERLTSLPLLLDVDDAVHLKQRGESLWKFASKCQAVICGNSWLADRFSPYAKEVEILPTGVDTRVYTPPRHYQRVAKPVIGWIGTSSNHRYLLTVERALARFLERVRDAELLIVSDRAPPLDALRHKNVRFVVWNEREELKNIQRMSVGIMPLIDDEWARGKCSYKMLQYMSCGVPAVASPVGMNVEVGRLGGAILPKSELDWVDALTGLTESASTRDELGAQGRQVVISNFDSAAIATRLATIIRRHAPESVKHMGRC